MDFARRSLVAVAFMTLGLVALVVDGVDEGWTTLGAVGVAFLALAIAAQLVALRQHRAT